MRYLVEIMYDGTNYAGFQKQMNAKTIQNEIEKSLKIFFKEEVLTIGASRTDTGVHANQNYFHFDFNQILNKNILYNLNALLPKDIAIIDIFSVSDNFNARYNAISRTYHYSIHYKKNPLKERYSEFYPFKLNKELIQIATSKLLNHTDYIKFSKKTKNNNNNICNIKSADWKWEEDNCLFCVQSNRFLRGMVRGIVGTILQVGRNNISIDQFEAILNNSIELRANFAMSGKGLNLMNIEYPLSELKVFSF